MTGAERDPAAVEPAADLAFEKVAEGGESFREYTITEEVYEHFLKAFDDRSPIHVDADAARRLGFSDRVMHGAILNGFISHMVGMVFPGRRSLLLSADLRYSNPSYLGDRIQLKATAVQVMRAQAVVVLNIVASNLTRGVVAGTGRVLVRITGGT